MSQLTFNIIVGVLIRSMIIALAGMLSAHGLISQSETAGWIEAVSLFVLTVLWSLYQKYVSHQLAVTLEAKSKISIPEAKAVIANGLGPSFTEVINGGTK